MRHLVAQSATRKSQLGHPIKHAGAHLYHAATGVADGGKTNKEKHHRLRKAFARMRANRRENYDMGTHSYLESV